MKIKTSVKSRANRLFKWPVVGKIKFDDKCVAEISDELVEDFKPLMTSLNAEFLTTTAIVEDDDEGEDLHKVEEVKPITEDPSEDIKETPASTPEEPETVEEEDESLLSKLPEMKKSELLELAKEIKEKTEDKSTDTYTMNKAALVDYITKHLS